MKTFLAITTALFIALPTAALSQPQPSNNNTPTTRPAQGQRPVGSRPSRPNRPGNNNPGNNVPTPPPGNVGNNRPGRPGNNRPTPPNIGGPVRPVPPIGNVRPPNRPGNWRPPGWRAPRANQWFRGGRWINRMRAPMFRFPSGWSYQYWGIGDFLPSIFLTSAFYWDNITPLGLPIPPPGFRWVRYGPDLYLVDMRTGRIADAAYGVFY